MFGGVDFGNEPLELLWVHGGASRGWAAAATSPDMEEDGTASVGFGFLGCGGGVVCDEELEDQLP